MEEKGPAAHVGLFCERSEGMGGEDHDGFQARLYECFKFRKDPEKNARRIEELEDWLERQRKRGAARAEEQLRLQVKDSVDWLKRQGAI